MKTPSTIHLPAGVRLAGGSGERGVALLLALGVLSLLMMLALSFAMTSSTGRQAAAASADQVRARILAESGLERALGFISHEFANKMYPGADFYWPDAGNSWAGRGFLPSINGTDAYSINDALNIPMNNVNYTPKAQLHANVGWLPITSKRHAGGVNSDVIIGRVSYVVVDESGKIDPGAVAAAEQPARSGASPTEIPLASLGLAENTVAGLKPKAADGKMPDGGRWYSMSHIAKALPLDQAEMDKIAQTLHPFSYDREIFWRDANANGIWDEGEDEDRIDLSGSLRLTQLYDLFLGSDKSSLNDDCDWLKETASNPWVKEWLATSGITAVQARQRIAAQIAANIIDYADADTTPTLAHIGAGGAIESGHSSNAAYYNITGVEKNWGVSEVAMRVRITTVENQAIADPAYAYGIISEMTMDFSGSGTLAIGNGIVHANDKITISGSAKMSPMAMHSCVQIKMTGSSKIYGDTKAPSYSMSGSTAITGNKITTAVAPISIPDIDFAPYRAAAQASGNWPAGGYYNGNLHISGSGTIAPPGGILFVDGDLQISGSQTINCAIIATGNVKISGSGVQNKIGNYPAVMSEFGKIDLSGSHSYHGLIYAKNGNFEKSGSGAVTGSIMCKGTFTKTGSWSIMSYEDSTPTPPGGAVGGTITALEITPGIKAEVFYPWATGANGSNPPGSLNVSYTVSVITGSDKNGTAQGTVSMNLDQAANIDGGTIMYTSDFNEGPLVTITDPFEPEDWYVITECRIDAVTLTDGSGHLVDKLPGTNSGSAYLVNWVQNGSNNEGASYYGSVAAIDPLHNDQGELSSDYHMYWQSKPDASYLHTHDLSDMGALTSTGYASANFSSVSVKDSPVSRIGELGRIHSYQPMRSLRLWSSDWETVAAGGHDADIVDLFKIGGTSTKAGKVNVNTLQPKVLEALLDGVAPGLAADAAAAVIARRGGQKQISMTSKISFDTTVVPNRIKVVPGYGSFAETGFLPGHTLTVSGTSSNNRDYMILNLPDEYTIEVVGGDASGMVAEAAPAGASVTMTTARHNFRGIGDFLAGVATVWGHDASQDQAAEEAVTKIAELVSVRPNYFSVLVCAQAIKDVAGVPYDSNGDTIIDKLAALNKLDVRLDTQGKLVSYVDRVLAEQKILAIVYRDAITNKQRIERFEYINQ